MLLLATDQVKDPLALPLAQVLLPARFLTTVAHLVVVLTLALGLVGHQGPLCCQQRSLKFSSTAGKPLKCACGMFAEGSVTKDWD